MTVPARNWAGNVAFRATRLHRPTSVDELANLVAEADQVRAIGATHSFSPIADTTGDLIALDQLPKIVELDPDGSTVTVSGGIRYADLAKVLLGAGRAVANLPSLLVFSVAGATATGSHGSGTDLGGCASAISGVEIITASGETLALRRDRDEDFLAAPVNLGALGIVSALTLDTVPTFDITEYEYEGIPEPTFIENLEEIFASGYSVSVFTNWQGTTFDSARVKCLGGSPPMPEEWMGARWSRVPRIPRQGVVGPWCSRLPHEEAAPTRKGTQTEYFVPRALAREAIEEMIGLARLLGPVLRTSEIRTIAADDLWLSPCYRRDSLSIHFTWKEEMTDQPERLAPVLATIESALAPFGARPHWGKLFSTAPEVLADLYEQMSAFGDLGRAHDPSGKFTNAFLERTLGLRS